MWQVVVGFVLFFGGIFGIVTLVDGAIVEYLGSKIYKKPVDVTVFENEEMIIPYDIETKTIFDDEGISRIYTYHLKYAETKDGKQYNLAPREVVANGKKYKTTPGFPVGVYVETREPIEELEIDGHTFRPGKTLKPKWAVDWQTRVNLESTLLVTGIITMFAGLFIMVI